MNVLAAPAIILTAAVTLLAILIAIGFAILVSRVRRSVNIFPPAMTGNDRLERAIRVQGNTVEGFVLFVPSLWLAALYFQGWIPPAIGLIWCLGRVIFAVGYMQAADKRHIGFVIAQLSVIALWILAVIGLVQAWIASSAV